MIVKTHYEKMSAFPPASECPSVAFEMPDAADGCFEELAKTAALMAGTPAAAVFVRDAARRPIVHVTHGFDLCAPAGARHVCEESMSRNALVSGAAVTVKPACLSYCAALPVTSAKGEVIGAICVRDNVPVQLGDAQQSALDSVAKLVAASTEAATSMTRLRLAEADSRDTVEHALDCMCVHELDGSLLRVNRAMVAALEYDDASELIGQSVRSLLVEQVAGEFDRYIHAIASDGIAEGEMRVRTRSGAERVFHYRNTLRSDGQKDVVLSTARDVTDAVAMRRQLRDSERRHRALFEHNAAGAALVSAEGEILDVNDALVQLLGYTSRDELKATAREIVIVYPEEAARLERDVLAYGAMRGREIRLRRRDGSEVVALVGGAVVEDNDGRKLLQMTLVDITARKGEEEEVSDQLRQSERDYRGLFEHAHEPVLVLDEHECVLDVNRAACRVYGIEKADFVGRSMLELSVEPTGPDLVRKILESKDDFVQFETLQRHADGSVLELEVSAGCVMYGGRRAIVSINRNVTEERRVQAERERYLSVLRTTLDTSSDAICVLSKEDRILMWNPVFADLWGFADDDLQRLPGAALRRRVLASVVNPEALSDLMHSTAYFDRQSSTDQVELLDGRVMHRIEKPLILDQAVAGRVISMRDITAQKLRAQQEQEHRQRLSRIAEEWLTIFDAMPLPMLVVDDALIVHRLNRAASAMMHNPAGGVIRVEGKQEPWATIATLCGSGRTAVVEVTSETSGQEWEVSVSPFSLEEGRRQSIVVIHDVTLSHDLQRSLRQFEAISELGTLVVAVAHEVRNPLAGIAASLDALEACLGTEPAQGKFIIRLRRELGRLNGLMADLLEYGRARPLRLTTARIEDVLVNAVAACVAAADARGVELRLAPFRSSRETTIDPDRMLQVIQNAIDNAVQHSPAGDVVWIRAREESRVTGVWTIISVEDHGSGFDPSSLPRVFEPFFTRRPGGTGLGLSLVQKIVREHGGTVAARNAPNGGAILEIALRTFRESNA